MQLSPEQFVALRQAFTRSELEQVLRLRNSEVSSSTVDSHLYNWSEQGRILQVKRGVYARAGVSVDPFLVASKLSGDAVLSHHAALELHGLAQSFFNQVHYSTLSSVTALNFEGTEFIPVKPRAGVRDPKFHSKWVELVYRSGEELSVTSVERTLVDVLDRPELAGGVEEVWRSVRAISGLRFRRLESYLVELDRATLVAKAGFFLERYSEQLAVPSGLLKRLGEMAPRSKVYFKRSEKGERKFISRWNLVVPKILVSEDFERIS